MLSPLLYSLFTHDCTVRHDSNTINKFVDDTIVIGLITDNDETAYREVRDLAVWCLHINLSLKTKGECCGLQEKEERASTRSHRWAVVEQVESFKFLGVHITDKPTWSKHTKTFVKRAQQNLFPLRFASLPGMATARPSTARHYRR
jgi:hypothetical protein